MIRPLSGLTADVVDSVFNLDSRILRTIGPLYFRPGFLTTEYFIGRRVRYVTPFRLFFFLTVIAFLITQIYSEQMGLSASIGNGAKQGAEALATIQAAETPEAVTAQRDLALAGLDAATKNVGLPEEARREIEAARKEIRAQAQERMEFLEKVREAKAKGLPPPVPPEAGSDPGPAVPATGAAPSPPAAADDEPEIVLFNEPWDPKTKPLTISWLPDAGNAKLNQIISTAVKNAKNIRNEPKRFVAAFFGVVPQTLFVLMPLFAVMLKFFYLFKRRYYMEHLIVAIHSHAFLSLSMLVISLLGLARLAFPAAATPLGWLATAATFWIPLYLLLMQRRVYRQNWFMTLFKYSLIGTCYSVLIALAIAVALIISLIVA
ncbi:MAG: DUF3667 domain-containing protein [Rhodanobacteraceae bacterium]|nr:DUF3667 domain-containing protein [Rhodanobacteraceae bacterium]